MSSLHVNGIKIHVYVDETIVIPFNDGDSILCENLIVEVAKRLKICPLIRHLFALKNHSNNIWLSPNQEITKCDYLEFRLRYKLPNVSKLRQIDSSAFNYYFQQCRKDFIAGTIKTLLDKDEHCLGLVATDLLCKMREQHLSTDQVIKGYKNSTPKEIVNRYFLRPVKESIKKAVDKGDKNCERKDANFFKEQYLEKLFKTAPDYGCEEFEGYCLDARSTSVQTLFRIHPYDEKEPGIQMKFVKTSKTEWIHVCSFMDLCYITIRENDEVEINRKNGIPQFVRFSSRGEVYSFVSLLDGYYRLSEKFLFNLCCDLTTPSLLHLKAIKCHGPISDRFAHYKLRDKRQNKAGCYLLRQSDSKYDTFYLDVCEENKETPTTYTISLQSNGKYTLSGNDYRADEMFDSMEELMRFYTKKKNILNLIECLPPSEHDVSDVHLCRLEESSYINTQKSKEVQSSCICISHHDVFVAQNQKPKEGDFTIVKKGYWHKSTGNVEVAVKSLIMENNIVYLKEFMKTANKAAFWQDPAIITVFGIILANPFSIVMEYFPLGPLDVFLQNHHEELSEVDLVEASTHLARALWYLDEKDFFHGNICCRNIMVAKHGDKELKVKLSDSGLPRNDSSRIHWLAVECYKNNTKRSIATDVWAYGTTLWEIFSFGEEPLKGTPVNQAMAMYKAGTPLPSPCGCPLDVYRLMKECWTLDPDYRIKPQAIMRDINQILLHVYNYYQGHRYSALKNSGYATPSLGGISDICTNELETFPTHENSFIACSNNIEGDNEHLEFDVETLFDVWEIDRNQLDLGKCLGKGHYGEVWKAFYIRYGVKQEVAVKQLKESPTNDGIDDLYQEINIMKPLDHPNIVKVLGYCYTDSVHWLVMEYVPLGALSVYLYAHKTSITHNQLLKYALNITEGMKYLEEKKVVHRDLAARNILVASEEHTKISDFGLARNLGDNNYYRQSSNKHIPAHWYAPECLLLKKFSSKGDVWSFGITLWEMFSYGLEPSLCPTAELIKTLQEKKRLSCPGDCPVRIYCIMMACWEWEAYKRPTFVELFKQLSDVEL